ncbi:hypothetical protein [Flaviaesturariibacter terrae]
MKTNCVHNAARLRSVLAILVLLLAAQSSQAQGSGTYKFKKIDAAMLQQKVYSIDSGAHAVVLADVGATNIDLNRGRYAVEYSRHLRIHILDKTAYNEASIQVPLYKDRYGNSVNSIDDIKAVSYNLVDGKVVETKMTKDAIFTEKAYRYEDVAKFTLPAVREGTIIDVQYKIYSAYGLGIRGWTFQGKLPRLWSEYTAAIPQFTEFQIINKGYLDVELSNEQRTVMFGQTQITFNDHRWVARDVPAFEFEGFVASPLNYLSRVEFHLVALQPPLQPQRLTTSWTAATRSLLEDEGFGNQFDMGNGWLNDAMAPMMKGSPLDQARAIYAHVRDAITCDGRDGIYLSQSVKDVFKKGAGTVADVNLLLTTMLLHAKLDASPVLLSTRENGFVYSSIPMLDRFNYVVVALKIDDQTYYLDASKPRLGFGRLLPECYNGMARIINHSAEAVMLVADSLREKSVSFVQLNADGHKGWKGTVQQVQGYSDSYDSRKTVQDKGRDAYYASLKKEFPMEVTISNAQIDSLTKFEEPVGLRYDISVPGGNEDILYINPMMNVALKENPFRSAERIYPVEMPYTIDQTYILRLEIPEGYVVDELPKPVRVNLNERNEASYLYMVSEADGVISLRSQIRFDRANYQPDEYEVLREFYTMILAKQHEQIVLKKKK